MRRPERKDGYAPIEDYALIGDGRAAALVALDGSIDWLCLPEVDAPPVLAALLDAERGGRFSLRPREEYEASRRYLDETNVLETIYTTKSGTAKVVDAIVMDGGALLPWVQLVRKVEGIEGEIELEWRLEARPRWGQIEPTARMSQDVALVEWEEDAIAVVAYDCDDPKIDGKDVQGKVSVAAEQTAMLAFAYFDDDPYAILPQSELEVLLERTGTYWETYAREIPYHGPWRAPVRRSVLAQRLLTYPRTGAIAAAATTSLPERIGADRNWDYRFSWVRDTSLALESLLAVRLSVECQRSLGWVVEASRQGKGLQPMYTLDGSRDLPREDVDFEGYRGSRPVRVGNDAQDQLQLGGFGDVIGAAYRFCSAGHQLDKRTSEQVASLADDVCEFWQRDDSGIWEVDPQPFTTSKIACWSALDRALSLAGDKHVRDDTTKQWKRSRDEIREWIEANGWSSAHGAYVLYAGSDELDASLLLGPRYGYFEPGDERFLSTIDAIRRELGVGPFLYRTTGLRDQEGCFLACSFWLVDALARMGDVSGARELMDELVEAANDEGLYAEQIDPETRAFLGNTPQALTHLSLILAAVSVMNAERDAV